MNKIQKDRKRFEQLARLFRPEYKERKYIEFEFEEDDFRRIFGIKPGWSIHFGRDYIQLGYRPRCVRIWFTPPPRDA